MELRHDFLILCLDCVLRPCFPPTLLLLLIEKGFSSFAHGAIAWHLAILLFNQLELANDLSSTSTRNSILGFGLDSVSRCTPERSKQITFGLGPETFCLEDVRSRQSVFGLGATTTFCLEDGRSYLQAHRGEGLAAPS